MGMRGEQPNDGEQTLVLGAPATGALFGADMGWRPFLRWGKYNPVRGVTQFPPHERHSYYNERCAERQRLEGQFATWTDGQVERNA